MQIFHLKLFQLRQVQAKKPCHEGVQSSRLGRFFCRLVLSAAASGRQWNGSCCSSVVAFGTSAASRLNATTANRQTWSIIFNGGHKLLMQAHPVPSLPTERMVSRTWSLKATRPNRIINLGKSCSRMSLLEWEPRRQWAHPSPLFSQKVFIKLVKWASRPGLTCTSTGGGTLGQIMALIKKEMYFMARKIFIWKSSLKVHIEATMGDPCNF